MNESLSPSQLNLQIPRGVQSIRLRRHVFGVIAKYGTIIGMFLMIVVFSIAAPSYFFTISNFVSILNQSSLTGIIAGGLTVAVIVGELDLSIGFSASFAGVLVTGLMVYQKLSVPAAIGVVLLIGIVLEILNGLIYAKLLVTIGI